MLLLENPRRRRRKSRRRKTSSRRRRRSTTSRRRSTRRRRNPAAAASNPRRRRSPTRRRRRSARRRRSYSRRRRNPSIKRAAKGFLAPFMAAAPVVGSFFVGDFLVGTLRRLLADKLPAALNNVETVQVIVGLGGAAVMPKIGLRKYAATFAAVNIAMAGYSLLSKHWHSGFSLSFEMFGRKAGGSSGSGVSDYAVAGLGHPYDPPYGQLGAGAELYGGVNGYLSDWVM